MLMKCKRWYWGRQNLQFEAPIVALYTFEDYLVVATKVDLFISKDAITWQKVER